MPSPITPGSIEPLIPAPGGSLCEKLVKNLLRLFPERLYTYISYERNEDGTIADGFAADIRAIGCFGSDDGTTPPGTLGAPSISATDGDFLDKVRITWAVITNATSYDVYRNDLDSVTTASLIGTTASTQFDDMTAVEGQTYYYWVRAKNATLTSGFSNSDSGFLATELTAVTDLMASQGFSLNTAIAVQYTALVWTPTAGASRWDIYRGDTDSFSAATLIDSSRVPFDNSEQLTLGPAPYFVNNATEVVYFDEPPIPTKRHYYWVVGRGATGGSASTQSNSALGWAVGDGNLNAAEPDQELKLPGIGASSGESVAGYVRAYFVLFGTGAGGAGANAIYGGGGGGAGPMIAGHFNITGATPRFRLNEGSSTVRSGFAGNGANGSSATLQFAPDGTTWTTIATTLAPSGGLFASAGSGAGGAGSSGTVSGGAINTTIWDGRAGLPGMGSKGGRGGNLFGSHRVQPANFIISQNGDGTSGVRPAGSGSSAAGSFFGGVGKPAIAFIFLYAA